MSPPPQGLLTIVEPLDGAVMTERSIIVRGLAPPGATITRVIPFWLDDHTRADSTGRWSFAVNLIPDENTLTFRIGDDATTTRFVTVHYDMN